MSQKHVYLSGRFDTSTAIEKEWLQRTGCKHRCFSFAVVDPQGFHYCKRVVEALEVCQSAGTSIMMDSGAHSIHQITAARAKNTAKASTKKIASLEELQEAMYTRYVEYCKRNSKKWKFYVTLDYKRVQSVIYKMQQRFHGDGLAPMPVFHGESSLDWLKKHKDMGHKYIAIGGAIFHKGRSGMGYYFDQVFNFAAKHDLIYHGLALTSIKVMEGWPWYSVDSSTWSRVAGFGCIVLPDKRRGKFYNVHVSERHSALPLSYNKMNSKHRSQIAGFVKEQGFDIEKLRTTLDERHIWNGYVYSNLEKFGVDVHKEKEAEWTSLL